MEGVDIIGGHEGFEIGDEECAHVFARRAEEIIPAPVPCFEAGYIGAVASLGEPASLARLRDSDRPLAYLGLEPRLGFYAPTLQRIEEPPPAATTFMAAMDEAGIAVVDISGLPYLPGWGELPGAEEFVGSPEQFGFQPLTPGSSLVARLP